MSYSLTEESDMKTWKEVVFSGDDGEQEAGVVNNALVDWDVVEAL